MAILQEQRMTISEAAAFCQRDAQSVRRWVKDGLRGVKLEAMLVGGGLITSREAVERFLKAINGIQGA